jgi:ribulose-5-phosphate 4-epimerase/fuculose-1-phosphate aldolase
MDGSAQSTHRHDISDAEWEARVDLAMGYRMAFHYRWANLIYNHLTVRVPGTTNQMLIKPHDLLYEEVCASNLLKIDFTGKALNERDGNVNAAGYQIHSAVMEARPDVNAVVHLHPTAGIAISASKVGLLPASQTAMLYYNRIAYHDYEGIADGADEKTRLQRDIGMYNMVVLRNHGLLTCGVSIAQALFNMRQFVVACEAQAMAMAMGELNLCSPELAEATAVQWEKYDVMNAIDNRKAYLRLCDKYYPDYKT